MIGLITRQEIEKEYIRCVTALNRSGIISILPKSKSSGVLGLDGNEYPLPALENVVKLFSKNKKLIAIKTQQGFKTLQLTPIAIPTLQITDLLKAAIIRHNKEGKIFQTRHSLSEQPIPVHVNNEKQIWFWERLRQAIEKEELVYFPQAYKCNNHHGQTKSEVIDNKHICAFPGWSVGLVENLSKMPLPGQGKTLAGRKQLEIGNSPFEYLMILQKEPYQGESGQTLEDYITKFICHLETTNEVSNDVSDNNALWLLGNYLKISYAELVPTARWHRSIGRLRLDMHRTRNKKCTMSWGCSTIVRLPGQI